MLTLSFILGFFGARTIPLYAQDEPSPQETLPRDAPPREAPPRDTPPTPAPTAGAASGERLIRGGANGADGIELLVNKSTVISTARPYRRVSVAQPDVADVNPLSPTSFLLTAKRSGATQVMVWDEQDRAEVVNVEVRFDGGRLQKELKRMYPASDLEVTELNGSVILRGRVNSLDAAKQIGDMAAPFGKVLNQLEVAGGQQVMLQVRVAEVSRSATTALGVNFGGTDGVSFAGSNIGQISPLGVTELRPGVTALAIPDPSSSVSIFGKGAVGSTAFAYFISALRQNNLLRILAEPNLVASSGEPASFLAGGEFPIPVTQGGTGDSTAITIEYREFGVRLEFVAVTLGDGRVRLRCSPEVSDLDFANAVRLSGFVVPGLSQRKITTTVELNNGQTLAIAGLLNQTVTANKDVIPLLGDLPVLGALFRSVRYQRRETELVVFVTPVLVEGMNPDAVPPAPGEAWRHPNESELFFLQDLGGPPERAKDHARAQRRRAPLFQGPFGFTPAPETVAPAPRR